MKKVAWGLFIGLLLGGISGIWFERSAAWHDQEEWMQIAQEACDMRLKTLKFTCKK